MATFTPISLSKTKYDEISRRIHESFPDSCVLWIDQVSNPQLESEHETLFENIKKRRPDTRVEKKELFHGTTEYALKSICDNGFDVSFNKTSSFGKGTYFARNAKYSFSYSTKSSKNEIVYMLLCSVIIGKTIVGSNNMIIDKLKEDNSIDTIMNPNIFVTPYDKGGIPKYLIAFHKNAS